MRQLSEIQDSLFVPKLYSVVYPTDVEFEKITNVFMVMDHLPGDLKNLLQVEDGDPQNKDGLVVILYNMLCCLNFFHSANLMHRDIKPSNFLINNECSVILCDFGLSRNMLDNTISKKDSKLSSYLGKFSKKL